MGLKILSLDDVIAELNSVHPLPSGLSNHFKSIVIAESFRKWQFLFSPPSVCRQLYFIKKGLLRSYYEKEDGTEVTNGLYMEGDFVVAVHSFYTGLPSAEYIQALESTEVYYISVERLQEIYKLYPSFSENGRLLTIKYLVDYSAQLQLIRAMSAEEKMKALRIRYGPLMNRVPQKYLASYVDMDPATFSKLKSNKIY